MRIVTIRRRAGMVLAAFCAVVALWMPTATGLDFDDLVSLIENGVQEPALLGILRDGGGVDLDAEDEAILRRMGVSEQVIALARTAPASDPAPVMASPSAPVASLPTSVAVAGPAPGTPVTPIPLSGSTAFPSLYAKEGWLSVGNQDAMPYYFLVNPGNKRLFISRSPNGGYEIAPGQNLVLNLRKETYKLYGDSGRELKVRVREGESTTLRLVPFGVVGNSGLQGVAQDRDQVRSEVLFNNYVPPAPVVVVDQPPVVIVPEPRPRQYYYFHDRPR
ncbi:MAG: hypothetical protein LIQ30_09505, partial [Planctomycetes bacterium]|nr:hypothetical protein [Planctomycetota bacterium]